MKYHKNIISFLLHFCTLFQFFIFLFLSKSLPLSSIYLSSSVYIFLNKCLRPHFLSHTQFCRLIATLNHAMLQIGYAFCLHIKYSAHPCTQRIRTSVLVMSYSDINFGVLPVAFLTYCVLNNVLCHLSLKMQYIGILIYFYFGHKWRRFTFSNSCRQNTIKYHKSVAPTLHKILCLH